MISQDFYRPLVFISIICLLSVLQFIIPEFKNHGKKRILINITFFIMGGIFSKVFYLLIGLKVLELPTFFAGLNSLPTYLDILFTVILFDFLLYIQHRLFHKVDFLWKLHLIHHSDKEMDLTSGIRFHPLEILISLFYKYLFVYFLNPSITAFLIYEILVNSFALFNHSNIKIKAPFERVLRILFVTPQMHYPHHDESNKLMNSNFGNIFSFWDRLFRTYSNEKVFKFGLKDVKYQESKDFLKLLISPFR